VRASNVKRLGVRDLKTLDTDVVFASLRDSEIKFATPSIWPLEYLNHM